MMLLKADMTVCLCYYHLYIYLPFQKFKIMCKVFMICYAIVHYILYFAHVAMFFAHVAMFLPAVAFFF